MDLRNSTKTLSKAFLRTAILQKEGGVYSGSGEILCPDCPYRSTFKHNFHRHMTKIHRCNSKEVEEILKRQRVFTASPTKKKRVQKSSKINLNSKCHSKTKIRPFECDQCGKCYFQHGHLTEHIATHFAKKPFKCKVCHREFNRHRNLRKHLELAHRDGKYKVRVCHPCKTTFVSVAELNRHLQLYHSMEKPFVCKFCGHRLESPSGLRKHVRLVHKENDKPWKCTKCSMAFRLQIEIEQHMFVHRNKPAYECQVCKKFFETDGQFRKHARKYHKDLNTRVQTRSTPRAVHKKDGRQREARMKTVMEARKVEVVSKRQKPTTVKQNSTKNRKTFDEEKAENRCKVNVNRQQSMLSYLATVASEILHPPDTDLSSHSQYVSVICGPEQQNKDEGQLFNDLLTPGGAFSKSNGVTDDGIGAQFVPEEDLVIVLKLNTPRRVTKKAFTDEDRQLKERTNELMSTIQDSCVSDITIQTTELMQSLQKSCVEGKKLEERANQMMAGIQDNCLENFYLQGETHKITSEIQNSHTKKTGSTEPAIQKTEAENIEHLADDLLLDETQEHLSEKDTGGSSRKGRKSRKELAAKVRDNFLRSRHLQEKTVEVISKAPNSLTKEVASTQRGIEQISSSAEAESVESLEYDSRCKVASPSTKTNINLRKKARELISSTQEQLTIEMASTETMTEQIPCETEAEDTNNNLSCHKQKFALSMKTKLSRRKSKTPRKELIATVQDNSFRKRQLGGKDGELMSRAPCSHKNQVVSSSPKQTATGTGVEDMECLANDDLSSHVQGTVSASNTKLLRRKCRTPRKELIATIQDNSFEKVREKTRAQVSRVQSGEAGKMASREDLLEQIPSSTEVDNIASSENDHLPSHKQHLVPGKKNTPSRRKGKAAGKKLIKTVHNKSLQDMHLQERKDCLTHKHLSDNNHDLVSSKIKPSRRKGRCRRNELMAAAQDNSIENVHCQKREGEHMSRRKSNRTNRKAKCLTETVSRQIPFSKEADNTEYKGNDNISCHKQDFATAKKSKMSRRKSRTPRKELIAAIKDNPFEDMNLQEEADELMLRVQYGHANERVSVSASIQQVEVEFVSPVKTVEFVSPERTKLSRRKSRTPRKSRKATLSSPEQHLEQMHQEKNNNIRFVCGNDATGDNGNSVIYTLAQQEVLIGTNDMQPLLYAGDHIRNEQNISLSKGKQTNDTAFKVTETESNDQEKDTRPDIDRYTRDKEKQMSEIRVERTLVCNGSSIHEPKKGKPLTNHAELMQITAQSSKNHLPEVNKEKCAHSVMPIENITSNQSILNKQEELQPGEASLLIRDHDRIAPSATGHKTDESGAELVVNDDKLESSKDNIGASEDAVVFIPKKHIASSADNEVQTVLMDTNINGECMLETMFVSTIGPTSINRMETSSPLDINSVLHLDASTAHVIHEGSKTEGIFPQSTAVERNGEMQSLDVASIIAAENEESILNNGCDKANGIAMESKCPVTDEINTPDETKEATSDIKTTVKGGNKVENMFPTTTSNNPLIAMSVINHSPGSKVENVCGLTGDNREDIQLQIDQIANPSFTENSEELVAKDFKLTPIADITEIYDNIEILSVQRIIVVNDYDGETSAAMKDDAGSKLAIATGMPDERIDPATNKDLKKVGTDSSTVVSARTLESMSADDNTALNDVNVGIQSDHTLAVNMPATSDDHVDTLSINESSTFDIDIEDSIFSKTISKKEDNNKETLRAINTSAANEDTVGAISVKENMISGHTKEGIPVRNNGKASDDQEECMLVSHLEHTHTRNMKSVVNVENIKTTLVASNNEASEKMMEDTITSSIIGVYKGNIKSAPLKKSTNASNDKKETNQVEKIVTEDGSKVDTMLEIHVDAASDDKVEATVVSEVASSGEITKNSLDILISDTINVSRDVSEATPRTESLSIASNEDTIESTSVNSSLKDVCNTGATRNSGMEQNSKIIAIDDRCGTMTNAYRSGIIPAVNACGAKITSFDIVERVTIDKPMQSNMEDRSVTDICEESGGKVQLLPVMNMNQVKDVNAKHMSLNEHIKRTTPVMNKDTSRSYINETDGSSQNATITVNNNKMEFMPLIDLRCDEDFSMEDDVTICNETKFASSETSDSKDERHERLRSHITDIDIIDEMLDTINMKDCQSVLTSIQNNVNHPEVAENINSREDRPVRVPKTKQLMASSRQQQNTPEQSVKQDAASVSENLPCGLLSFKDEMKNSMDAIENLQLPSVSGKNCVFDEEDAHSFDLESQRYESKQKNKDIERPSSAVIKSPMTKNFSSIQICDGNVNNFPIVSELKHYSPIQQQLLQPGLTPWDYALYLFNQEQLYLLQQQQQQYQQNINTVLPLFQMMQQNTSPQGGFGYEQEYSASQLPGQFNLPNEAFEFNSCVSRMSNPLLAPVVMNQPIVRQGEGFQFCSYPVQGCNVPAVNNSVNSSINQGEDLCGGSRKSAFTQEITTEDGSAPSMQYSSGMKYYDASASSGAVTNSGNTESHCEKDYYPDMQAQTRLPSFQQLRDALLSDSPTLQEKNQEKQLETGSKLNVSSTQAVYEKELASQWLKNSEEQINDSLQEKKSRLSCQEDMQNCNPWCENQAISVPQYLSGYESDIEQDHDNIRLQIHYKSYPDYSSGDGTNTTANGYFVKPSTNALPTRSRTKNIFRNSCHSRTLERQMAVHQVRHTPGKVMNESFVSNIGPPSATQYMQKLRSRASKTNISSTKKERKQRKTKGTRSKSSQVSVNVSSGDDRQKVYEQPSLDHLDAIASFFHF